MCECVFSKEITTTTSHQATKQQTNGSRDRSELTSHNGNGMMARGSSVPFHFNSFPSGFTSFGFSLRSSSTQLIRGRPFQFIISNPNDPFICCFMIIIIQVHLFIYFVCVCVFYSVHVVFYYFRLLRLRAPTRAATPPSAKKSAARSLEWPTGGSKRALVLASLAHFCQSTGGVSPPESGSPEDTPSVSRNQPRTPSPPRRQRTRQRMNE